MTKRFLSRQTIGITITTLLISVFIISTGISYLYSNSSKTKNNSETSIKETSGKLSEDIAPLNVKLKFYTIKGSSEKKLDFEMDGGFLSGKTRKYIDNFFSNSWYKVESIGDKDIILVKTTPVCAPNVYLVGVEEGEFAVYKTDEKGTPSLYSKSGKKVQYFTELPGDRNYIINELINCKKHYKSPEEAEESLESFE